MDEFETKRQEEFRDQQAEVAGINNGRQARFLSVDGTRHNSPEKRERHQAFQSQLDLFLNDPIYQARYNHVLDLLEQTQAKLNHAITTTSIAIERLQDLTDDMEDRAAKLDDGTAVFLGADGMLYSADGQKLGPKDDFDITISDGAPNWEQYKNTQDALRAAQKRMHEYGALQDEVLTPTRDKLNDKDNPPNLDELDDLERDLKERSAQILEHSSAANAFSTATTPPEVDNNVDTDLISGLDLGTKP